MLGFDIPNKFTKLASLFDKMNRSTKFKIVQLNILKTVKYMYSHKLLKPLR